MTEMLLYDKRTLRFLDAGTEEGLLLSQQPRLVKFAFWGFGIFLLTLAMQLALALVLGWSTSGGVTTASQDGLAAASVRNWSFVASGIWIIIGLCIPRAAWLRTALGPGRFELAVSMTFSLIPVIGAVAVPWYSAKIAGVLDPASVLVNPMDSTDDRLLLYLDMFLTGTHMLIPLRWIALLPLEVVTVLIYVAALVLGSHVTLARAILNLSWLCTLILCLAWGKRSLERGERDAFAKVAVERTLRCEAEHRLSKMSDRQGPAKPPSDLDSMSLPTTARSGRVFELSESGDGMEVQLGRLINLGLEEHWIIEPSCLQLTQDSKVLGCGSFGMTFVALYHGAEVVIKVPRDSRHRAHAKTLVSSGRELRILRRLHHPNLVMFYGACIDPSSSEIVLVLEYIRGSPLPSVVSGIPETPQDTSFRCRLADGIFSALRFLHAQHPKIIHGDIKDSNVVVDLRGAESHAKLLDFGLSRLLTKHVSCLGGTVNWMAPEVIRKDPHSSNPSADIFSLGRLLFTIMTGRCPLSDMSRKRILDAAGRGQVPALDWPDRMPLLGEVRELCELCTQADPASRPNIVVAQACLHMWARLQDLPEELAEALGRVLPGHALPQADLQVALQKARREQDTSKHSAPHAGSPEGAPLPLAAQWQQQQQQQQQQHEQQQEQHGNGRNSNSSPCEGQQPPERERLMAPLFDETPNDSKALSLNALLRMWNVPLPASTCCSRHARMEEMQRVLTQMQTMACKETRTPGTRQCPTCKLVITGCGCLLCSDSAKKLEVVHERQQISMMSL